MKTPVPLRVHANDLNQIDAAATASGMSREDVLIVGGIRFAKELTASSEVVAPIHDGAAESGPGGAEGAFR